MPAFLNDATTWITKYWSPDGLLDYTPVVDWKFREIYLSLIGICLLGALLLPFLQRNRPSLKEKLSPFFWTNTVLGLILFFFRDQQIPLLGMDLWRFLQELGIVIWLFLIIRFSRKHLNQTTLTEKIESYRSKYLPKPKTVR